MTQIRHSAIEAGLVLMRSSLRSYEKAQRLASIPPGRITDTSLGSNRPSELAMQGGFFRMVSIVEAALDLLAVELTNARFPQVDETLQNLIIEKELSASSNWGARRQAFQRHHGIDIRKCDDYRSIEAATEVRNAIAHGLGRLTTRQLLSQDTPRRLATLQIQTANSRILIKRAHLTECVRYGSAFLLSVDRSLPSI